MLAFEAFGRIFGAAKIFCADSKEICWQSDCSSVMLGKEKEGGGSRMEEFALGEKLAKLRKKYGYSQQEIADMLSVTRQTISNWECGQGAPALDKAAELARIYQISLDDLAGNTVEIHVSGKSSQEGSAAWNMRMIPKRLWMSFWGIRRYESWMSMKTGSGSNMNDAGRGRSCRKRLS